MKSLRFLTALIIVSFCLFFESSAWYEINEPVGVTFSSKLNGYVVTNGGIDDGPCQTSAGGGIYLALVKPGVKGASSLVMTINGTKGIIAIGDSLIFTEACVVQLKTTSGPVTQFAGNPFTNWEEATFRGLCHDGANYLYLSAINEVYRLDINTKQYKIYRFPNLERPYGLTWDKSRNKLIIVTNSPNSLVLALDPADSTITTLKQTTIANMVGITQGNSGEFYVSSWGDGKIGSGKIYRFDKDFAKDPEVIVSGLSGPSMLYYNPLNDTLAVPCTIDTTGSTEYSKGTVLFFNASDKPKIPEALNVGDDGQPVSTTPVFRWKKSGADKYQLQVAVASMFGKDDSPNILSGEFDNPVIDEQNIADTFYVAPKPFDTGKKYVWHVRSQKGSDFSAWSQPLTFEPGKVNAIEDLTNDKQMMIYPNPVTDYLYIKDKSNEPAQIFNMQGFKMFDSTFDGGIDVSGLTDGMYILRTGGRTYQFIKLSK